MKIKVLSFDYDGVITDSMKAVYACSMAVLRHFGLAEITFSQFYEKFRMPYMDYYRDLGLPMEVTLEEVRAVYFGLHDHLPEQDCVDGIAELLAKVRNAGIPAVVVSAHVVAEIEAWLKNKDLYMHFDCVYGMAVDKTSILKQLASEYGCDRSEVAIIGDLPSDMRDAKAAGAIGIGLAATENMRAILLAAGANHVFDRLEEIGNLI
jgi:phosphoglycolate phosphatase-like HAD superfamily hydrolase